MKAQILKIAGVKSEKEFYKKYPSEEAFMKVHGKAFKKAAIGSLIGGESPKQFTPSSPKYINFQEIYDEGDKLITGSTQAERDKAAYDQALLDATKSGGGEGGGNMMGNLSGIMSMAGMGSSGEDAAADMPDMALSRHGRRIPVAQTGFVEGMGMDSENGYGVDNYGNVIDGSSTTGNDATSNGGFMNGLNKVGQLAQKYAPAIGQIGEGLSMLKGERKERLSAEQQALVSDATFRASKTREEESKRRYVRPEDIQNTGEEFFPIYGVGTNVLTRNGGAIRTAQDGDYIGGNPTEIQNTYSDGYDIYTDGGYEPLYNPYQVKDFRHGGSLYAMQDGGGTPWGSIGGVANNLGYSFMGGENGGGKIGSTIGSTAGTLIGGPLGGAIGGFVGGMAGNLLDTNGRDTRKAQDRTRANTMGMALNSGFQALEAQNNKYMKAGGYMNPEYNPQVITMFGDHTASDFADYAHKYRAGGHLKEYTPPSERAMQTFAMGGQLETHWGGKAETISHNPYMPGSGETVLFRGQSHNESDRQGNTGIGISYGGNPVEVERGEPMFELASGGEINPQTGEAENTGVVFGNMPIDKKIAAQLNDPELMEIANKYHGKKFKNIGIDLAKQEALQNKKIAKNTDELQSLKVNTPFDKLKFASLKANLEGADAKLKNIANTKITLANYQNSINDAKDEMSEMLGTNLSAEHLAKGLVKIDKDPVTMNNRWGGNIVKKAQNGTTTPKPKTFKSEREANAAGYHKGDDGKYHRTIHKYSTKTDQSKAATAMDNIPKQSLNKGTGFAGGVTKEKFEQFKKKFSDYPGIDKLDPKDPISLHDFKIWANNKAKEIGSTARILDDPKTKSNPQGLPIFGDQYLSFNIDESKKSEPVNTEEELTAIVNEPNKTEIPEEKARFPWEMYANQAIRYLTPSDQTGMDYEQLYPEWFAMASNQLDPVPAQFYQPDLNVPYDISLQAERNAVIARDRALQKQLAYNPSAQSNAAPLAYNAINDINAKEFQMNQAEKSQVYAGNRATMNEAQKMNLGIAADQWQKQALAKSNTKATTEAALSSIADKYAKHKLENRTLSIYENMYNYRFGKSGRAQNYNGLQFFDTQIGSKKATDDEIPGLEATRWDKNGTPIAWKKATDKTTTDDDLEAVGGIKNKNGGSVKKDNRNSSIVKALKNL